MQLISSDIICKDGKGRTGKFSTAPSEPSHLVHVIIFLLLCGCSGQWCYHKVFYEKAKQCPVLIT